MAGTSLKAFTSAGLPAIDMGRFSIAAASAAATAKAKVAGVILVRLLKDGRWVYGSDDVEVQEGALWSVNPLSMSMGWAAWGDEKGPNKGKLMGERMALITAEKPIGLDDCPNVGETWKAQVQFDLVCVLGEDEGTQVRYKNTSVGGGRAFSGLLDEVSMHASSDGRIAPVIELLQSSYKHKDYGQTYTPVFHVHEWRAPLDGTPVGDDAQEGDDAGEGDATTAPSANSRRGAARAVAQEAEAPAAPAGRAAKRAPAGASAAPKAAGRPAARAAAAPAAAQGGDGTVDRGAVVRRRRA